MMIELKPVGKDKVNLITTLPDPLLGHMVIKVLIEDATDYLNKKKGVTENSLIEVVHGTMKVDHTTGFQYFSQYKDDACVPITKGVVIKKAKDVWGERFKYIHGQDIDEGPEVGDIVVFPGGQSTALDPEGHYHMIADNDIWGIYRQS